MRLAEVKIQREKDLREKQRIQKEEEIREKEYEDLIIAQKNKNKKKK